MPGAMRAQCISHECHLAMESQIMNPEHVYPGRNSEAVNHRGTHLTILNRSIQDGADEAFAGSTQH